MNESNVAELTRARERRDLALVELETAAARKQLEQLTLLEAFGEPGSLLELLDTMVNHVADEAPDLELPLAASMSYPAWLGSLVA